ncbi:ATP-dependent RNA helicase DDX54 [Galendromus occidentalis]|uniref:RNA helicase n=1 Tax=Galendromus occidentalis TaxID=34638 RepID=A0AAJ7PAK3_9ACAR|nr:ATP-dependent RNA helicase DDX54 [Galendromus occidentalis]
MARMGSKGATGNSPDSEEEMEEERIAERPDVNSDSEDDMKGFDAEKLSAAESKKRTGGFQSLGLNPSLLKGIQKKGYRQPTPIQRKAIPPILERRDVVAMARTGSGKTAAFLLPMFEILKTHSPVTGGRALIISPTRELAIQTHKFCKELGKFTDLRSVVILGGDSLDDQFAAMHENPDIIIGTPGRLLHLVMEMNLNLRMIEIVVFDEADRLFEMGLQEQMTEILNRLRDTRQTVLFSATLPRLLIDFVQAGLKDPLLIRLDVDSRLPDTLRTVYWVMREEDKYAVLLHLLKELEVGDNLTVVFVPTKHHVEYIREILEKIGISCGCVYSSLDQVARTVAVNAFKSKSLKILLVTDVAARGIDIPLLDNVVNFSFPAKPKLFVHRVGRVARAGRFGTAYSFVSADEASYLLDLHLFLDRKLTFPEPNMAQDEDRILGSVPQSIIDEERANLDKLHSLSVDISNLQKVCANAMIQYRKARPNSSAESNRRMKALLKGSVPTHPMFAKDSTDVAREDMLSAFKKFKPNATIFEIGNTGKSEASAVMRNKRRAHDDLIERSASNDRSEPILAKQSPEDKKSTLEDADEDAIKKVFATASWKVSKKKRAREMKSFKDTQFYISPLPADHHFENGLNVEKNFSREAQSEVLDLMGEDTDDIRKKNNRMKWDRKKKRFVREDDGNNPKSKMIRTESGALVPASYKKDLYKQWKRKNNIDLKDNHEDEAEEGDMFGKQNLYRRELGVNQRFQPKLRRVQIDEKTGKRIKSELKRPEVILKEYKRKKRTQHQQKMAKKNREQGRTRRRKPRI